MRAALAASALAVTTLIAGAASADAKTCAHAQGPGNVTHGRQFAVTANGGTDTAGMRVKVCISKIVHAKKSVTYAPQACTTGATRASITAHPVEKKPGHVSYVAVVSSASSGKVLSVSTPITVTIR